MGGGLPPLPRTSHRVSPLGFELTLPPQTGFRSDATVLTLSNSGCRNSGLYPIRSSVKWLGVGLVCTQNLLLVCHVCQSRYRSVQHPVQSKQSPGLRYSGQACCRSNNSLLLQWSSSWAWISLQYTALCVLEWCYSRSTSNSCSSSLHVPATMSDQLPWLPHPLISIPITLSYNHISCQCVLVISCIRLILHMLPLLKRSKRLVYRVYCCTMYWNVLLSRQQISY